MYVASGYVVKGAKVLPTWLILTYFLLVCGDLFMTPVGMSAMTKLAPEDSTVKSWGVWFLSGALGNNLAGQLSGQYDALHLQSLPSLFLKIIWSGAIGALLMLLFAPCLKKTFTGDSHRKSRMMGRYSGDGLLPFSGDDRGSPPCHQCSNGIRVEDRINCLLLTRGSIVPSTCEFTFRRPAMDSSTWENGKSVPQKILLHSAMRYSWAAIKVFQNCHGRVKNRGYFTVNVGTFTGDGDAFLRPGMRHMRHDHLELRMAAGHLVHGDWPAILDWCILANVVPMCMVSGILRATQ